MIHVPSVPGEFYNVPGHYKLSEAEMAVLRLFVKRVRAHLQYADSRTYTDVRKSIEELPTDIKDAN